MNLRKVEDKGIYSYLREGTSDEKAFREVISKNAYEKRYFKIEEGEHWLDLGGYLGHFSLLAEKKGAFVECFEPDPSNYAILMQNRKANKATFSVRNVAVANAGNQTLPFYINKNGNFWRNSLLNKKANGATIEVPVISFAEILNSNDCVKMDIEGAEFEILENLPETRIKKLVFEWSFDIDPSIPRFKKVIEKLKERFHDVKYGGFDESKETWTWFPPARMVYCYNPK